MSITGYSLIFTTCFTFYALGWLSDTIFRQVRLGDWKPVIAEMVNKLKQVAITT